MSDESGTMNLASRLRKAAAYLDEFDHERVDTSLLREAAAALETMGAWQPIETAPKDGTMILLANDKLLCAGFFHRGKEDEFWWPIGCSAFERDTEIWEDREQLVMMEPTHWMSLTKPPA